MPRVDCQTFLREYSDAVNRGNAALFAGAGLSRASGFVDWANLLAEIAEDVGLRIELETDFPAVAQYNLNKNKTRAAINQAIVDEFAKAAEPSESLRALTRLPIRTYWTTNYDTLIEDALNNAGRLPDVKRRPEDLATTLKGSRATVYKMHGDVSQPERAVVTKEDYETYELERSAFTTALRGDVIEKTFLFIGFSFTDPNIDSVLARIRVLLDKNQRRHFVLLRRPRQNGQSDEEFQYASRRFDLRIDDLRRYSIYPVLVDDFDQIPPILAELERLNRVTRVFVSGAARKYDPLGESRLHDLCSKLGDRIIADGKTLVSGFGLGLGGAVVLGAAEAFERLAGQASQDQLRYRPFPQEVPQGVDRDAFYAKYRRSMLSDVGIAVFVSGNRQKPTTGEVEISPGVLQEFELALELGVFPIPIGATGYAARQLWERMVQSPARFSVPPEAIRHFTVLGDSDASNDQILESFVRIVSVVQTPRAPRNQA